MGEPRTEQRPWRWITRRTKGSGSKSGAHIGGTREALADNHLVYTINIASKRVDTKDF